MAQGPVQRRHVFPVAAKLSAVRALRMASRCLLAVFALGLATASCTGESGATALDPPEGGGGARDFGLSNGAQPIFTRNCAFGGCHGGSSPQQGMNLSAGLAYSNTVNVPSRQVPRLYRVAPGDPDSSYLMLKLQGLAGAVGGVGTRMPLGGQLTPAQIDTIRAWIAAGAQNN